MSYIFSSFFYLATHLSLLSLLLFEGRKLAFFFTYTLREKYLIDFSMCLDSIRVCFLSFVALITFSVISYRKDYMGVDISSKRFITLVSLFVLSMFILIISPSFLLIMLGWDGLGVTSFLLVIYYNNARRLNSGLVTVYLNRFGDFLIILSFWVLFEGGWFQNSQLFLGVIGGGLFFIILLARITKRAQLPFSSWLPAAIAAPTPVSSLVHSSTLVTAGVYVILRFFYLIEKALISGLLVWVRLLTCLGAGLIACYENDLKKLVAISTLRQLGLMIFSYRIGENLYSFFHMVCHALFKALLFLRCGFCIIHLYGLQESRLITRWGSLSSGNLFTLSISVLSLIGFPFLTGFFSKDAILEWTLSSSPLILLYLILVVSCVLTGIYGLKGVVLVLKPHGTGVGLFRGALRPTVFFGIFLLGLWSVALGKSLSYILGLLDLPLVLTLIKMGGLIIVLVGTAMALLKFWTKIISPSPKSFFGDMFFLNWFYGGFRRKRLEGMIGRVFGEFGWLHYLGGGGLYLVISLESVKTPFYLGGVKISFFALSVMGVSSFL